MITIISLYVIGGAVWSGWLEYFTTNKLDHPYNTPWVNGERLYHIALWPFSFSVFVYGVLKEVFGNKPE